MQQGFDVTIVGFVDDDVRFAHQIVDDLPVLGAWSWFEGANRNGIAVICASGFSEIRKRMAQRAMKSELSFANAISPLAHVSERATIGRGVVIYAHATVGRGSVVGDHVLINAGSIVSHDNMLEPYATLNPAVSLAGNVSVAEGAYLGIGCNAIQGIRIGAWSTVGAGAVVTRDVPDRVTAVGVPAKVINQKTLQE